MSQLIKSRIFKRLKSSLLSGLRWYISSCRFMRETRTRPEGVPDVIGENLERQMLVYRDYLEGGGGLRGLWQEIKRNSRIQMGVSNIRKAFVSFSMPWWNWASSMNCYLLLEIHCCSEYIRKEIVALPLLFAVLKYTSCEKNKAQYFIKNCWISLIGVGWPCPASSCPPSCSPPRRPGVTGLFLTYFSSLPGSLLPSLKRAFPEVPPASLRASAAPGAGGPLQNRLELAESSSGQSQPLLRGHPRPCEAVSFPGVLLHSEGISALCPGRNSVSWWLKREG